LEFNFWHFFLFFSFFFLSPKAFLISLLQI
jgi:hypothetical protein